MKYIYSKYKVISMMAGNYNYRPSFDNEEEYIDLNICYLILEIIPISNV